MRTAALVLIGLATAPGLSHAASAAQPGWKVYADCAAAYRVNSEINDPSRAPGMKQMIGEQSDGYVKAARGLYAKEKKAADAAADTKVREAAAKAAPRFAKMDRDTLDKFIESCPQVDE